jgi:uncharacterized SAM-binding protein YcdF (DUF218 family)
MLNTIKKWSIRLISLVGIITIVLFVTADCWLPGIGQWLAQTPHIHPADALVVHGGGQVRTRYGIVLYQQNLAPEFWHTGHAESQDSIVPFITEQGVPGEQIHYLTTDSTWEDGQAIVAFIHERKVQSILVVTEWWHSRRALCSIKQQLHDSEINIYYTPPTDQPYTPENWWQHSKGRSNVFSELLKFVYYSLRYGMSPWQC